jgi:hypothetical protein
MNPIVEKKLEEMARMATAPAPKRPARPSDVRVIDNNLSRVIRNQEEADRFMMELDALSAYNAMKRREKREKEKREENS